MEVYRFSLINNKIEIKKHNQLMMQQYLLDV